MLPGAFAVAIAGKSFDPANPRQTRATVLADEKLDKIVSSQLFSFQLVPLPIRLERI